ncbi:MAG TPA: metal ABC transporter permease [Candidatus Baltobacteraceae bacterium]|jgi:ABC-type Mn2+/Zn2+ transport system permease subunit|nr:metal ABC transporter permease [Candidatus Baltobacteraceae bacterium]
MRRLRSAVIGLYASYDLHAAGGAMIVLLATIVFFAAMFIGRRLRRAS